MGLPVVGVLAASKKTHGGAGAVEADGGAVERERRELDLADHKACAKAPKLGARGGVLRLAPRRASGWQGVPGLRWDLRRTR